MGGLVGPFLQAIQVVHPPFLADHPGTGGISNPVLWTKEVLQKDEAKTKRDLNSCTVAAALSSQLLPFCSLQAAVWVAAMMTRSCY